MKPTSFALTVALVLAAGLATAGDNALKDVMKKMNGQVTGGADAKTLGPLFEATKAKGKEFLDAAAKESGAQVLPSGVVIKTLTAGQLYDSLVVVFGPPARTPGVDPRQSARAEFAQFFASVSSQALRFARYALGSSP